jgi:hypothetical protein
VRVERFVGMIIAVGLTSLALGAACSSPGARTPSAAAGSGQDGGATGASAPLDAASPDAAKGERPFAGSATEATQLVSAAIDKHREEMGACVNAYKTRKKLGRARVEVQVGIDQEGNLLGATLKGGKAQDEELTTCVQRALATAQFPRSHAGVISVTKVYEEMLQ